MNEWDKLCDAFYTELKKEKEERSVFELLKIFNEVRAEGDKLQDRVEYLEGLTNGNGKIITSKLLEIQKLEQKLEAIRTHLELIYPESETNKDKLIQLSEDNPEGEATLLYGFLKQAREVLGDE